MASNDAGISGRREHVGKDLFSIQLEVCSRTIDVRGVVLCGNYDVECIIILQSSLLYIPAE